MTDDRTVSLYKTVLVFIATLLGIALLYTIQDILKIFFLAFLFGFALNPVITWLESKKVPRGITIILIIILIISLLIIWFWILIPAVFQQVQTFLENFPIYQKQLVKSWQNFQLTHPSLREQLDLNSIFNQMQQRLTQTISPIFTAISSIFYFFATMIVIIVLAMFGLTNPRGIHDAVIELIPHAHKKKIIIVFEQIGIKIGSYLRGVVIAGLIIGIASYIGFSLIGLNYALTLAIISGIFEMVPLVGPIISGATAVTIALFQDPVLGLYTLIFCIGLQQLENHLLIPKLMSRQVGLHPLTIISATLILVKLLGFIGFFLAVPTAATIKILVNEIYLPYIGKQNNKN